jgi:hypothetical protein
MEIKKDFTEFIALLQSAKVKYLIVGGYAVSYHTQPRATGDIDFFYERNRKNCQKLHLVLMEFIGPSNISLDILMTEGKIVMIGLPPNRIDLINKISGMEFNVAWKHRIKGYYGQAPAWFIAREDLLTNKKASNRLKDQQDIACLE